MSLYYHCNHTAANGLRIWIFSFITSRQAPVVQCEACYPGKIGNISADKDKRMLQSCCRNQKVGIFFWLSGSVGTYP